MKLSLLFFSLSLSFQSFLICSTPLRLDVSAKSAVLINSETGAILYAKNPHSPEYPASTTKVITALYALEKRGFFLDEPVTASYEALATSQPHVRRTFNQANPPHRLELGGTHMGIKTGEVLSFRTLLYGLMLSSGNDAANVIAQHVSGSIPAFMAELNAFIKQQGCVDTVLFTPHGLYHPDHKVSAFDMAKLTQLAMKNPFFREVVKTVKAPRPQTNKQPPSELIQHNALVKPGRFYYPKATGVKTGYTAASGYAIVVAAEDENRKLIAVLFGCDSLIGRYKDAIALFEAAFNEKKVERTLFSKGFDFFSCTLPEAKTPLEANLSSDVILSYYPSEEPNFKTKVNWNVPNFPVKMGQMVGEVQVLNDDGKLLMKAPLFAAQGLDSKMSFKIYSAWKSTKSILSKNITLILLFIGICVLGLTFYFFQHTATRKRSVK